MWTVQATCVTTTLFLLSAPEHRKHKSLAGERACSRHTDAGSSRGAHMLRAAAERIPAHARSLYFRNARGEPPAHVLSRRMHSALRSIGRGNWRTAVSETPKLRVTGLANFLRVRTFA